MERRRDGRRRSGGRCRTLAHPAIQPRSPLRPRRACWPMTGCPRREGFRRASAGSRSRARRPCTCAPWWRWRRPGRTCTRCWPCRRASIPRSPHRCAARSAGWATNSISSSGGAAPRSGCLRRSTSTAVSCLCERTVRSACCAASCSAACLLDRCSWRITIPAGACTPAMGRCVRQRCCATSCWRSSTPIRRCALATSSS